MARFMTTELRIVAAGLNHPECVVVGSNGTLYAGGQGGEIYRISTDDGEVEQFASTGGESGGLALDAADNLYECSLTGHVNRITPDGNVSVYSSGAADLPAHFPNYPVFDREGNLFFSDSGHWGKLDGRIYVVRPNGDTDLAIPDYLSFPNGLAYHIERGWLYIVQSGAKDIIRVQVTDGRVVDRPELYVSFPKDSFPDGIALAESGSLYVACYEPDIIYIVEPNRRVDVLVEELEFGLLNRPTNVAFGRQSADLYIANYGEQHISVLSVGEPGMPLSYPSLPGNEGRTSRL